MSALKERLPVQPMQDVSTRKEAMVANASLVSLEMESDFVRVRFIESLSSGYLNTLKDELFVPAFDVI